MAVTVISGGQRQSFGDFDSISNQGSSTRAVYHRPNYLINAARRKYGRNIFVIGAVEKNINEFWENIEIKASAFDQRPQQVAQSIVDVTTKEHRNTGIEDDEVLIYSNKVENKRGQKSYSLSFEKGWEFGGTLNVGAPFFNIVGTGGSSLGLGGSTKRVTNTFETLTKKEERSLSQQYSLTGRIKVPPRTASTVKITTYAVTYNITTNAVFTTPTTNVIAFYYKSGCGKICCGGTGSVCRSNGFISAEELFRYENNFKVDQDEVTFTRETNISYLGETVQMCKTEKPLDHK